MDFNRLSILPWTLMDLDRYGLAMEWIWIYVDLSVCMWIYGYVDIEDLMICLVALMDL